MAKKRKSMPQKYFEVWIKENGKNIHRIGQKSAKMLTSFNGERVVYLCIFASSFTRLARNFHFLKFHFPTW